MFKNFSMKPQTHEPSTHKGSSPGPSVQDEQ